MSASDLALVRGLADTRATLDKWSGHPWPVLRRWIAGSLAITGLLLVTVWAIAVGSVPDPAGLAFPGLSNDPVLSQVGYVVFRNRLVLALHAMACVAGLLTAPRELRCFILYSGGSTL